MGDRAVSVVSSREVEGGGERWKEEEWWERLFFTFSIFSR
jgi:hypothetical protein